MPSKYKIITNREQHHRAVNQTAPIHAFGLYWRREWEESKDVNQEQEQHRDDVASESRAAQTPASAWKRLPPNSSQCDARYRDDVGAEDRADCQRDYGVECYTATEVDER